MLEGTTALSHPSAGKSSILAKNQLVAGKFDKYLYIIIIIYNSNNKLNC